MTNSSSLDRDDSHSEILELESIPSNTSQSTVAPPQPSSSNLVTESTTPTLPSDGRQQMKVPPIVQSIKVGSTGETLDVTAELDLLLQTLAQANPHPPQIVSSIDLAAPGENCQERERRQQESRSISETLAAIAASELNTDTLLHQELNNIYQQIATARSELQTLHQSNRSQVEAIDANADRVNRLKVRTQQLAYYTKNRVGKVQELISTIDAIRSEIVTGLAKFGGYREIRALLAELETSRQALVRAHDRLCTRQEDFYASLQVIEERVSSHSIDAVERLRQYQELIESLFQTISTDRLQIASMSVDLSLKYSQLQDLGTQITDLHAQITDKSHLIHRRLAAVELGFSELAESVRLEKNQFYELTAATIDRAQAMQSQFNNIAKEFSLDREAIAALQSELIEVRAQIARSSEQQLDYFDLQFYELLTDWNELSGDRLERGGERRQVLTWLWILSVAIGLALAFSIYIVMHLK